MPRFYSGSQRVRGVAIALALVVFCASQLSAYKDFELEALEAGMEEVASGRHLAAGERWQSLAETQLSRSGRARDTEKAAASYVMATVCFERGDDARAYETWSLAIRYFLEAESRWEEHREGLTDFLESQELALRLAPVDVSGGFGVSRVDELKLKLIGVLGLDTFDGPRPGLSAEEAEQAPAIRLSRSYFARSTVSSPAGESSESRGRLAEPGVGQQRTDRRGFEPLPGTVAGSEGSATTDSVRAVVASSSQATGGATREARPQSSSGLGTVEPRRDRPEPTAPILGSRGTTYQQQTEASAAPASALPRGSRVGEERPLPAPEEDEPSENADAPELPVESLPGSADLPEVRDVAGLPSLVIVDSALEQAFFDTLAADETPSSGPPKRKEAETELRPALELTKYELLVAERAWRYFLVNRQPATNLVNAVHQYSYTTLWDVGSSIAGLVSAHQLGLASDEEFYEWFEGLVATLAALPLYRGELPNREYSTRNGRMTDIKNQVSAEGSGWSTLDIGRLLIWLRIAANLYSDFEEDIERIVAGWDFSRLSARGYMDGVFFDGELENLRQEGRLGYEQYAARGFRLWGISLPRAEDYDSVRELEIFDRKLMYDNRGVAYLTSEPFVLAALELGEIDPLFTKLTREIYEVQEERFVREGQLTAVSEDAIDRRPWFVYNTVLYNDSLWACVRPSGKSYTELRSVSTKAAFGWQAIYRDEYGQLLRDAVEDKFHSTFGYYSGVYESGGTNKSLNINTNGVLLEIIWFHKVAGLPLLEAAEA